jgi:hypothetical protein
MLIVQHIAETWDKAARGANSRARRPRLAPAYPLPPYEAPPGTEMLLHCIAANTALQRRGPSEAWGPVETIAPLSRRDWLRGHGELSWRSHADRIDIILSPPSGRLQTRWPAHLPRPLFALRPGDTARIEWSGRLATSLGGSVRSSYYAHHIYWLAFTDRPAERLFLDATPRKSIDLTAHIY